MSGNIQEVLKAIGAAMANPIPDALAKAYVQPGSPTTGLNAYDLEAPAKLLFPVITPLRNDLPRVGGGVGTAVNWRAITGINTSDIEAGVGEGQRGAVIAHTTTDYTKAYRGIGLEDDVTFEADYAANTFDDVKARAVQGTLWSTFIQEEKIILGGNGSLALGTTPTPVLAGSASGGSLATLTYSVICVALTLNGFGTGAVSATGVRGRVTRTNADATTAIYGGGSAQQSASATVAITGPTGSITATVADVRGAFAYAWYVGAVGSERIYAITTINSVAITAAAGGTGQLASAIANAAGDNSVNALVFDGMLTTASDPTSNAYYVTMPTGVAGTGTPLTADTRGGIVEFDTALKFFWDQYKISPDEIWISSQEQKNINAKILVAGTNSAQRFVFDVSQNKLMGGTMTMSYLNPYGMMAGGEYGSGKEIPIKLHPNMPAGTVMFRTKSLPYKLSNVNNIQQIKTRKEYYQLEWPLRTRKYEYGVYADELLQNYAPFTLGVIKNIANG